MKANFRKVALVDDSPQDRLLLRTMLERLPDIEIAGEAACLKSAKALLARPDIDLAFLDIELGRDNSFSLLRGTERIPPVVFTTVHREFALASYDVEALDYLVKRPGKPRRILDVGTGTGVLAIAAARAWKMRVLASDIDPLAVKVARENARANDVGPAVEIITAAGLNAHRFRQRGPYDLVLANILLGPLVRLAPLMPPLLAPSARVVLSGLLDSHAHTALMAYRAQGLMLEKRIRLEGWTTLILRKPSPARGRTTKVPALPR